MLFFFFSFHFEFANAHVYKSAAGFRALFTYILSLFFDVLYYNSNELACWLKRVFNVGSDGIVWKQNSECENRNKHGMPCQSENKGANENREREKKTKRLKANLSKPNKDK